LRLPWWSVWAYALPVSASSALGFGPFPAGWAREEKPAGRVRRRTVGREADRGPPVGVAGAGLAGGAERRRGAEGRRF
jgi:hypothetical protein